MTPGAPLGAAELRRRVDRLWTSVEEAGGSRDAVTLVAVTKGFDVAVAELAASCDLRDLGENYAQELLAKAPVLAAGSHPVRWHAIGRLQRNKVRQLAPVVHLWQTVDRLELAAEIARRAPGARVLVQVNTSGEPAKGGIEPTGAPDLVRAAGDLGLAVEGLMTVGRTGPPESARPGFTALSVLADRLGLAVRCMGMSGDVAVAVQEGATMVRIGSALFGPRPARPPDR